MAKEKKLAISEFTQKEIRNFLLAKADKKHQKFSQTLTPNAQNILGIKVPVIKQFAKELAGKISLIKRQL